jgi:hypothetical protein
MRWIDGVGGKFRINLESRGTKEEKEGEACLPVRSSSTLLSFIAFSSSSRAFSNCFNFNLASATLTLQDASPALQSHPLIRNLSLGHVPACGRNRPSLPLVTLCEDKWKCATQTLNPRPRNLRTESTGWQQSHRLPFACHICVAKLYDWIAEFASPDII